ncbi:MAG: ABC transporter ATP-binding protein [Geminicoccaceae bacterium]
MAALSVEIREKRFAPVGGAPAKLALEGLAFAVEPGETVALIGPSGCGKSTLLNIVAGLDRDFAGRIETRRDERLAYVFQEPRLLPWRTVEDNLRLVLGDGPDVAARIEAALTEVGLEGARRVFASRLSLGMARRVALARAFVVRPALLLLDEPFVSLDEPTARRLRLLLLDLLAAHGASALFVTHNLREAIMLAHRILFLSPSPAHVMTSSRVDLERAARADDAAIEACRTRLIAEKDAIGSVLPVESPAEADDLEVMP